MDYPENKLADERLMKDSSDSMGMGMSLLKKSKLGILRVVFSRAGIFVLLLIAQALVLFGASYWLQSNVPWFYAAMTIFAVCVVIYLINSDMDPTGKITWLLLIMALPVFGILLLCYTKSDLGHRLQKKRIDELNAQTAGKLIQSDDTMRELASQNEGAASLARYVNRTGHYPVYQNTEVTYYPLGDAMWPELLLQLNGAKRFIYLEYFIVQEGEMWGSVLEVLARKAAEGVDVRVMYDGTCEGPKLPGDYPKRLEKLGIHCKEFAPITPFVSTHYNYRDHRKIAVIDGESAFTGGINLADEYVNKVTHYGHWKDTAVMLKGEAVQSFTLMFLQAWDITEAKPDFSSCLGDLPRATANSNGFVLPYGDCPLDNDKVGEKVYMDLLNRATKYVHIMSPYLILDGEMETAIKFAAERGVEVSLILPGIPDKKIPYALAKTHYPSLLASGVQIYEYTPGFVHAKSFVCDDREAVVGTINLDYRSLYHHFECAVYQYGTGSISDIEKDFQSTLGLCRRVTADTCKKEKRSVKITGFLAKAIAPLL